MWKEEMARGFDDGLLSPELHLFGRQHIDLLNDHAAQRLAGIAVECCRRLVGVPDGAAVWIDQQHDRAIVFEHLAKALFGFPQRRLRLLALGDLSTGNGNVEGSPFSRFGMDGFDSALG